MIKIISLRTEPTPSYDVYIGRQNKWRGLAGSKWQNPFHMKGESQRDEVIRKFEEYILTRIDLLDELSELDDKILACWCHNDEPNHVVCHGDILRKIRNEQLILKGLVK